MHGTLANDNRLALTPRHTAQIDGTQEGTLVRRFGVTACEWRRVIRAWCTKHPLAPLSVPRPHPDKHSQQNGPTTCLHTCIPACADPSIFLVEGRRTYEWLGDRSLPAVSVGQPAWRRGVPTPAACCSCASSPLALTPLPRPFLHLSIFLPSQLTEFLGGGYKKEEALPSRRSPTSLLGQLMGHVHRWGGAVMLRMLVQAVPAVLALQARLLVHEQTPCPDPCPCTKHPPEPSNSHPSPCPLFPMFDANIVPPLPCSFPRLLQNAYAHLREERGWSDLGIIMAVLAVPLVTGEGCCGVCELVGTRHALE